MHQSAVSAPVRWLVHVLSLLLVPVVVLAMPNVARAAPLGDWATAVFSEPVGGPIPGSINCSVNARWVEGTGGGTSIQVGSGSGCYSPGYFNSWEPGTAYTLSFQGTSCEGREFTSTWMTGANHDWNSNHMVVGTSMEVPAGSCVPSSVCIQGASTDTTKLCGSISLGAVGGTPATGSCSVGNVTAYTRGEPYLHRDIGDGTSEWRQDYSFTVVATANGGWQYVAVDHDGLTHLPSSGGSRATYASTTFYNGSTNTRTAFAHKILPTGTSPGGDLFAGVQITRYTMGGQTLDPYGYTPPPDGYLGTTRPSTCRFYLGEKVASGIWSADPTDGTASDVPFIGGVATVPDNPEPAAPISADEDESEACTFVWSDPSTWASAGICALVYLMDKAIGVLYSIVSAVGQIAGAILGGLSDLFVPDDIAWEGMWTQVQARPPFSVLADLVGAGDELADGFKAGSGSCGTVADFTPDGVPAGSGAIDCNAIKNSDGMSVLYGLVSAALIGLTAFAAWRMLQSSIGGRNA